MGFIIFSAPQTAHEPFSAQRHQPEVTSSYLCSLSFRSCDLHVHSKATVLSLALTHVRGLQVHKWAIKPSASSWESCPPFDSRTSLWRLNWHLHTKMFSCLPQGEGCFYHYGLCKGGMTSFVVPFTVLIFNVEHQIPLAPCIIVNILLASHLLCEAHLWSGQGSGFLLLNFPRCHILIISIKAHKAYFVHWMLLQ